MRPDLNPPIFRCGIRIEREMCGLPFESMPESVQPRRSFEEICELRFG